MSKAASPQRGQPQRGLSSWLTGPGPLSATKCRTDSFLTLRVALQLGFCCFYFCLSALGGLKEPSILLSPGGSSTPFPLPPGRLQPPA